MKRVSIKFFGRCEVHSHGGDSVPVTNKKSALLLARLAMRPGQTHDRKKLTELLWPDRGEAQALASLRQALWSLRKDMGEGGQFSIIADRSFVGLDPVAVELDTVVFERLVRNGSRDDLERAAILYRGDYLSEVDLDDADEFTPFVFERQRLRDLMLSALKTLIGARADAGDADGAIEVAQRALSIDPLQEDVHAAIIRLHRDNGRLGLARHQYEASRDLFRRELGIARAPEIEALRESFGVTSEPRSVQTEAAPQQLLEVRPAVTEGGLMRGPLRRRAVLGSAIAAFLAATLIFVWVAFPRDELPLHEAAPDPRPSLVVLPFADTSSDGGAATLAGGLTDGLINDLAKVSGLFVVAADPNPSTMGPGVPARQQAIKLGVSYRPRLGHSIERRLPGDGGTGPGQNWNDNPRETPHRTRKGPFLHSG